MKNARKIETTDFEQLNMNTDDYYTTLGQVGAEAARRQLRNWLMLTVDPSHPHWKTDEAGRTAFARAVIEEHERRRVEKAGEKWAVEKAAFAQGKLIEAFDGKRWRPVAVPLWLENEVMSYRVAEGQMTQAPEEVGKKMMSVADKLRKCCETHGLGQAGENADDIVIAAVEELSGKLAKAEARLLKVMPRPVSVQPTIKDCDRHGRVLLLGPEGMSTLALHSPWDVHKSWAYWVPSNLEEYGIVTRRGEDEKRAAFEAWAADKPQFALNRGNGFSEYYSSTTQAAWLGWLACASNEAAE